MDIESCKEWLTTRLVPYHQGVADLLLPGVSVKFKSKNTFNHSSSLENLCSQIDNCAIYPVCIFIDATDQELADCSTKLHNQSLQKVKFINKFQEIKYADVQYYSPKCGVLWAIVAQYDQYYSIFKGVDIYVAQETYNHAIGILTDEEVEQLDSYNIKITTAEDLYLMPYICYLSSENGTRSETEFYYKIKNCSLSGSLRKPCRFVAGTTSLCPACNKIAYTKYIIDGKCIACRAKPYKP